MKKSSNMRRLPPAAALAAALAALLLCLCSCFPIIVEYDETPAQKTAEASTAELTYAELTTGAVPEGISPSEVTVAEPDLVSPLASFPDRDFSDRSLAIAVASETVSALMPDEDALFYPACVKRAEAVAKKYGSMPQFISCPLQDIIDGIKKTQASGGSSPDDFYADVLEIPATASGKLALAGQLVNLHTLPFYAPAEDESSSAGSLNGRLWFEISETTEDPGALLLMLCRRDATNDGCASLYSAALSGKFTFEYLLTAAAGMAGENGAGKVTAVSSAVPAGILGEAAVLRSGLRYTDDLESGRELSWTKEENLPRLTALISSLAAVVRTDVLPESGEGSPLDLFRKDEAKFYVCSLEEFDASFREEKTDYALLPLPYATDNPAGVAVRKNVLCVPVINTRSEMIGLALNAFRAVSGEWIAQTYIPVFASEMMRDNDSLFTLKLILSERRRVDFAEIMGESVKNLGALTYEAAYAAMTSETPLAEITADAAAALNKLLAQNKK